MGDQQVLNQLLGDRTFIQNSHYSGLNLATGPNDLRKETSFPTGRLEKLLDFYSHPGYVAHKDHLLVAYDLELDLLETEDGEEIRVLTFTLNEALRQTRVDYRCDPEATLALWLYMAARRGL